MPVNVSPEATATDGASNSVTMTPMMNQPRPEMSFDSITHVVPFWLRPSVGWRASFRRPMPHAGERSVVRDLRARQLSESTKVGQIKVTENLAYGSLLFVLREASGHLVGLSPDVP